MRKSIFIRKKLIIMFVVLMSMSTMAAVVSDNDGAAFITKAEYDSMKNDFQSQIDKFNSSIDNKLDGAIDSYLTGVKASKQVLMSRDGACNYTLPLTCHFNPTKDLWNDEHSNYYKLSIPKMLWTSYEWWVTRMASDRSLENDVDMLVDPGGGGPYTVPVNHLTGSVWWLSLRMQYGENKFTYPGRVGELYRIDKDSSATRTISGTAHKVWNLRDILHGQDNLFHFTSNISASWDGKNETYRPWCDIKFIGYYEENPFNVRPVNWVNPTKNNYDAWTQSALKYYNFHSCVTNPKPESSHSHADWTTYADATTAWNTVTNNPTGESTGGMGADNWVKEPNMRVIDIQYSGKNTMIFAGDAYLPSYNEGGYSFTPRYRTNDKSTTKVTYKTDFYRTRQKLYMWNMNTTTTLTGGPYTNLSYVVFPEWHATPKTSFQQDSSNQFSTIRASLVRYKDSRGVYHYMDEGMYLGTFDYNGDVTFTIKVDSTATNQVNIIVSKKPIDINRSTNHYPAFTYEVDGVKTSVAAKSIPKVPTNKNIKIEVPKIKKGEQLYMIWWPDSTEYVQLTKFQDFYIYAN